MWPIVATVSSRYEMIATTTCGLWMGNSDRNVCCHSLENCIRVRIKINQKTTFKLFEANNKTIPPPGFSTLRYKMNVFWGNCMKTQHNRLFGELVFPHLTNHDDGASDWLTVSNQLMTSSGPVEWLLEASSAIQSQILRLNGCCSECLGKFRGVVGVVN